MKKLGIVLGIIVVVIIIGAIAGGGKSGSDVTVALKERVDSIPLSSITYAQIREKMNSMTEAQFKAYARGLRGKKVRWQGYVEDVSETGSGDCRLSVDMDPPGGFLSASELRFKVPTSVGLSLKKDSAVAFVGVIESVGVGFLGTLDVSLRVTTVEVEKALPKPEVAEGPDATQDAMPISDLTWAEIDDIYNLKSNKSELQKKSEWSKYKAKKVKWTGQVTSVSETLGSLCLQIKMNPDTLTSDLLTWLKESEKEKALKLTEGMRVTFVGCLDDWGTLTPITLKRGELVSWE